jgi:hypothetical protein
MRNRLFLGGSLALLAVLVITGSASAAVGPLYDVKATWGPTNLPPGGVGQFILQARNVGDEVAAKKLFIADELPAGVKAMDVSWRNRTGSLNYSSDCKIPTPETVLCEVPAAVTSEVVPPPGMKTVGGPIDPQPTGYAMPIFIEVEIAPEASGTATNTAVISGGGAPAAATAVGQVPFSLAPAPFGIVAGSFGADVFKGAYPAEATSRQAGDHPFELRVDFDLTAATRISPFDGSRETPSNGQLRTVEATLPRGLIGNPEAVPKCNPVQFAQPGVTVNATRCPADTQVGYIDASGLRGEGNNGNGDEVFMPGVSATLSRIPIYNLVPPKGTPIDFGFNAQNLVIAHIYASLDAAHDYAAEAIAPNTSTAVELRGAEVTIWGVPGDSAHDRFRYFSIDPANNPEHLGLGAPFGGTIEPFFTNPMDCDVENGATKISVDSYQHPGQLSAEQENFMPLNVTGCEDPRFRFEPKVSLQPTDRHAGAPTGLNVQLEVPQRNEQVDEAKKLYAEEEGKPVQGISTPPIKKAVVTFPEGMTLNPSAAQGLGACTSVEIGLGTNEPVRCPDNSQYGTLTLHTPILPVDEQPEGHIYIAKQNDNPFHSFIALYLAIEDPNLGILVKIPGRAELDPQTGQITTTFDDLPQFPVSDMQMSFNGGVRAALVEPQTCGRKTISAEFFSWQEPNTQIAKESAYEITEKPNGSPCLNSLGERPFAPQMEAGTEHNTAGEYSPFELRLIRSDEDQEFSQIGVKLPKGLTGKPAGVAECSDAGIAQALSRETTPGDGALEQVDPSCPASSHIGETMVGTGVGVPLTWVPGKVYWAGPYEGAPYSIVAISPAVVGPYDLGVVTVRTALHLDPETAQVTAASDPFPQVFQGIPVRIRDIRLNLNRPNFTLNPTSCTEKQIEGHVTGTGGDLNSTADDVGVGLSSRFQAADCASLTFRPRLSFRLIGATHRGATPALKSVLKMPMGGANIGGAQVILPPSEFIDNEHFNNVCTRVDFAAKRCPAGSIYGHAVARTPLFDFPLEGPVYLRTDPQSKSGLPDLVAVLKGPGSAPVEVNLVGHVDSLHGRLRTTFQTVPDAPVTEFVFFIAGGKKGLVQNAANLCAGTHRALVNFKGQNNKRVVLRPALRVSCRRAKPGRRPH